MEGSLLLSFEREKIVSAGIEDSREPSCAGFQVHPPNGGLPESQGSSLSYQDPDLHKADQSLQSPLQCCRSDLTIRSCV